MLFLVVKRKECTSAVLSVIVATYSLFVVGCAIQLHVIAVMRKLYLVLLSHFVGSSVALIIVIVVVDVPEEGPALI